MNTCAGIFPGGYLGQYRVPIRCECPTVTLLQDGLCVLYKDECLDRMILFGEASLRRALREYVSHYQTERNHQGVGNRLLEPLSNVGSANDPIHCREQLGGMLNFYYREAA